MNAIVTYPFYRAAGTPQELGRQHGAQAAEKITRHLDYLCESLALTRNELAARARAFEPLFARYCPHLLSELAGLAKGASITYGEALAVNIRAALSVGRDTLAT